MSRLPFNPQNMDVVRNPPEAPAGAGRSGPITVSQLATLIDRALRDHTPSALKVVGEIGQFRERSHWYFDIKDNASVVSCVMWQSAARKMGFAPKTGQQVVLTGHVEFYPPQGRAQLLVDKIEPVGIGALDLALRQLIEEARALGWLDEQRKRPLPVFPRKVAVITSKSGAALQDVIDTVRRRCAATRLALIDVRVQGEGSAKQVADAVRAVGNNHARLNVDVILVTRGGGSMEDLWAFNERIVAEAIVNCPIPVVCAIGHETDVTLAELVADVRAATPSQAAMRIAPDSSALCEQLDSLATRLQTNLSRHIRAEQERVRGLIRHARLAGRSAVADRRDRLNHLAARLERCRPEAVYARRASAIEFLASRLRLAINARIARDDLQDLGNRLDTAMRLAIHTRRSSVEAAARNLDLVGPPSVMKRGYSLTLTASGDVVRSASQVASGERVTTRLIDGSFASVVSGDDGSGSSALRPVAPAGRSPVAPLTRPNRSRARRDTPNHPTLFDS